MSFERLNSVFKQLAASNSYFSVRSVIEECSFQSNEQEKLVRLCLRKLPDWFSQTPEQIKEIKIHFHRYLLQTSSGLKQKQLIDLLLNELKETSNDYFVFLLTDLYDKNYAKLLHELEGDTDISYIIHLPDRMTNIFMTHIPPCFQAKTFFNRLSEYIQEQLITVHYPNMVAQVDTSVRFLCQLVHKAAKLGYTQYLWRPLYKNIFLKQCSNDSLWLRLAQYFLLETIDDILFYTIEHGNANTLDLFLSDRILHLPSLETYLTDTLLFRKQLPIEIVRTILIYLTMSTGRVEKCFSNVSIRFFQLWSQESFIRFSSNPQHFYICQCICICLSLNQPIDKDKMIMCVLTGIRIHLESTFDYIRQRGQFIGESIIERMNLFSQSNQLQFNTYEKNHPEIQNLRGLLEREYSTNDRDLSDEEIVREKSKARSPDKPVVSSSTIVLREASVNDDDDDSEFESYDYSHDTTKSDVQKPSYIRSCLADLLATEKVPQLEAALEILPSLIELYKIECEEIALELTRILLNYNSTFDIENFHALQLNGLITLGQNYPFLISDYLCKQFYERNYTISQRSLILKTIQETGKKLSQIEQMRNKIEEKLFPSDQSEEEESWRSIINQRLKFKSKYKRKSSERKQISSKENQFGTVVGHFFYPLIAFIDHSTPHLALIDGDNDCLLLCELLACLGRLCIHAQNTMPLINMIKQYFQVLKSLQQHPNAGVRHAVVYAYACCLVSTNSTCHDEELQMNFIELKQWFDEIILKDTNTEVQKLGRSVRRILLKTLEEIT